MSASPPSDKPESPDAGARAKGGELSKRLSDISRREAERWRIDRPAYVLVFGFLVLVGWWGFRAAFPAPEPEPPKETHFPPHELVFGALLPVANGRVQIDYTFDPVEGKEDLLEKFPQHRDWDLRHHLPDGSIVGEATTRTYFDGDVRIEFDAKLTKGRTRMHELEINPVICFYTRTDTGEETYYQFSVNTVGRALIRHVTRDGWKILIETRAPPLEKNRWHRFSFELTANELIGRLDGKQVCRTAAPIGPDVMNWGRVGLRCHDSVALFDNVRVVGRLAEKWIKRREIYLKAFRQLSH